MASRVFFDSNLLTTLRPDTQGVDSVPLAALSEMACRWIENRLYRRILTAAYRAWHAGDLAARIKEEPMQGAVLYLHDSQVEPLLMTGPVTAVSSVKENGVAIPVIDLGTVTTLPAGEGALLDRGAGTLTRVTVSASGLATPKSWAPGWANIFVQWNAGWALYEPTGPADNMAGADLCSVAVGLVWKLWEEGYRSGVDSMSDQGASANFNRLLTPQAHDTLARYALPRCPRTVVG